MISLSPSRFPTTGTFASPLDGVRGERKEEGPISQPTFQPIFPFFALDFPGRKVATVLMMGGECVETTVLLRCFFSFSFLCLLSCGAM